MTTAKTLTLVEKLIAVREEVGGYVQKKGRNSAQNYSFASEADITATIYPAFAKQGILFYPASRMVVEVREYTTTKGGKMMMTTTEAKWIATDGVDQIEVMTIGQGADSGDKGAYKGMAGDKKYAILQLLGIATGDDPEVVREDEKAESTPAQARANAVGKVIKDTIEADEEGAGDELADSATQAQKNKMFGMAREVGIDVSTEDGKAALSAIVLMATGKKSSKQLTQGDMDAVYTALTESEAAAA